MISGYSFASEWEKSRLASLDSPYRMSVGLEVMGVLREEKEIPHVCGAKR